VVERRQKAEQTVLALGMAVHNLAQMESVWAKGGAGEWAPGLL